MKKNKTYILLLFLIGCFYGCTFDPKREPMLIVNNNTEDVLYVYYSSKDSIQLKPELKSEISKHALAYTDENGTDHYTVVYPENRVDSFSKTYFHDDGVHTKGKFRPYSNQNYVYFFFIKESTMKNFTWKDIVQHQLYEKRLKYTYAELDKMNYEISYNSPVKRSTLE